MAKGLSARNIRLKRAYQPAAADDGTRILVDRLWPRGLKKSDAAIDRWLKDIPPSTARLCANGARATPRAARSPAAATLPKFAVIRISSRSCAPSRAKDP